MNSQAVRNSVLIKYWNEPERISTFSVREWELFFRQARACRLAAQWAYKIAQFEEFDRLPDAVQQAFEAAWTNAESHQRAVLWEARQVGHFLDRLQCKKILLKGAAYMAMDLDFAQGRLVSDLDILVPKAIINEAEAVLLKNGWATGKYKPYDQRYYREWMHELPPLLNRASGMTLDMHHNILPETSRRRIEIGPMLDDSVPVVDLDNPFSNACESTGWHVLRDVDMVIHASVHMFQEGEIAGSLRDMVDIDGLIRYFSRSTSDFQARLMERVKQLNLDRPVFYAIRYAHEIFDTPLDNETVLELKRMAPGCLSRALMDSLVIKALAPPNWGFPTRLTSAARFCLYVRSHYGRMPLNLLLPHLWHKTFPRDELPVTDNDGQEL